MVTAAGVVYSIMDDTTLVFIRILLLKPHPNSYIATLMSPLCASLERDRQARASVLA
jgi:hypothetical protein